MSINSPVKRTRGGRADVAVVGGGVVGAACALALAQQDLHVVLIEAQEPAPWSVDAPDLRVYAFAPDNAALLDAIGAWAAIREARAHPYTRMRVWDAAGGDELRFDADEFAATQLGWIVENALLQDRLWAALRRSGVTLRCPARVEAFEQSDDGVALTLDDGLRVEANIAIAADGGASKLRELAGIAVQRHDYGQSGVVAFVATESPHENTAWQRFLPTGPLAFLPFAPLPSCATPSSIVWTLPEQEAARVVALDDDAFSVELTRAFAGRLGETRPLSKRVAFPLRRQLAERFLAGRVLTVGDAAHMVHPLAGQGVNLGLRDVAALRDLVVDAKQRRVDWTSPHRLARWARLRRSDSVASAYAFSAINRVFSNDDLAATLLRGRALGLAGKLAPLNRALWRHAAGM
ncbi:MAG: UbiH/UbiF family hydroxylase [Xanthomonadaceae bacterium]|nr:UbiH/UbiF family hydroxylase [Xanthomonadaceae bacterium]